MTSSVYVIENLASDCLTAYVGKANDPKRRWHEHQKSISDPRPFFQRSHFYNALRLHGIENFRLWIVETCDSESNAFKQECEWISYLKMMGVRLYNKSSGGYGGGIRTTTEETRRKQSETHRRRYESLDLRKQISAKLTGHVKSKLTRNKLSASKKRAVDQLTMEGDLIASFESALEASKVTGACRSKISNCCKGVRQHTIGFRWRYGQNNNHR